jgi:hypothetical protein
MVALIYGNEVLHLLLVLQGFTRQTAGKDYAVVLLLEKLFHDKQLMTLQIFHLFNIVLAFNEIAVTLQHKE